MRLAVAATGILLTRYLAQINDAVYPVGAATVGALTGAFYATELVGSPLLGALGLTAATTALAALVLARLLEGLSAAATVPALLGRLGDATDGDAALRGRVSGLFEATTVLGTLVGVVAAAGLWVALGRGAFLAVAALYLVALGLFRPSPARSGRPGRASRTRGAPGGRRWRWSVVSGGCAVSCPAGFAPGRSPDCGSRMASTSCRYGGRKARGNISPGASRVTTPGSSPFCSSTP